MNPYNISFRPSAALRQFQMEQEKVKATADELMKEISYSQSDLLRSFYAYGQNPDPIVRAKGLQIYQEMMEDDQVKACVELRKQARLSTQWEILPGQEGNAESEKYAEFIRHVFDRIDGSIENNLYEIYSAIEYGFSVSELVYQILENGPFAGKVGLRAIKTREPFNYDFKVDDHGNLLGLVYTGITPATSDLTRGRNIPGMVSPNRDGKILSPNSDKGPMQAGNLGSLETPFPADKFVIYSYNQQFGNWYGRSDLFSAFRSWLIKKHVMKFWSIWLERYASPFIWAQYKRDAGLKASALNEIDGFIKNLSARQGIRVSDAVDINAIQFSTAGGDAYEKAIESHNRWISHAILCPNLIGITGSQGTGGSGGSYALGKTHLDAFVWILEKMGRDTSEIIMGEQIIRRLIDLNFPDVDVSLMPIFKFQGVEEASIEVRARIVTMLSSGGFINPEEDWIRDFLTIPRKDDDVQLPDPTVPGKPGEEKPAGNEKEEKPDSSKEDSGKEEEPKRSEAMALKKEEEERKANFKTTDREPNRFEKKLKVKEFAKKLDAGEEIFFADLLGVMNDLRDALIDQVERKKIIESGDAKAVEQLKMNVGALNESLKEWLTKFHLDAKLQALEELGRAGVDVEITRNFADVDAPFEPWRPLPPKEAIDFFNRKVKAKIVDRDGKKVLIELATRKELSYYDEKAFSIAGIVRDDILGDAKQVLLNGIKRQDRIGAISDLKNLFNRYTESGIEVDEELLQPHRLQTIVRTNMVEAINEGRRAMYEDENVKGFVEYWEYTAIMDARTTDYCRCMDGKVFRMEEMPLLNPPAHFNCRSFSVPVTRFELEDLKKEGRGIEISQPCADRAAGFEDVKREPVQRIIPDLSPPQKAPAENQPKETILPPASRSAEDIEATNRLREDLSKVVARCPYNGCHSSKISMTKKIYNVGEFYCEACAMPFRVSNLGDLYLYDAGTDKWSRVTMGLNPAYFSRKGDA